MALNINGTTGISGVDGSASAPALKGTDSNTGINFASDTVNINTGGTTRATVDNSGNLGVGETTPLGKLHVKSADSGASVATYADELVVEGSVDSGMTILSGNNKDGSLAFGDDGNNVAGRIAYSHPSDSMQFFTGASERMRINSSGTLFLGKTTQSSGTPGVELYDNGPNFMTRDASGGSVLGLNDQNSTTGDALKIYYSDVLRGSLVFNGSSFFAYTASDYRLKENDTPISDGITRVKQLRPVRFNWKRDATKTYDGFIAHEVQEVVPDCVVGEKDAEVDSREEGYQRLAVAGLVPVLTAALKDAIAKIEVLETEKTQLQTDLTALTARVAALEAG